MRNTFINNLIRLTDNKTFLMVGDLGYSVVEPFEQLYPNQFINAGIAEQNMTGMAAGLAMEGYKVFTYSIGNFNTIRCLEQVRNDICYHDLDVTIVSVGGGLMYGSAGYSHHAVQDIAIMGSLPNMTLLLPGDPLEVEYCVQYAFNHKGPKYLRIGKNGEPRIHKEMAKVSHINKIKTDQKARMALVSTSTMLNRMVEVGKLLEKENISVDIFSIAIIDKDFKQKIKILHKYSTIVTLEEHISDIGFGSLIHSALKESRVISLGLERDLCFVNGCRDYLCEIHGLSADSIIKKIKEIDRGEG